MADSDKSRQRLSRVDRRKFLKAASAVGLTAGIAGCTGDGDDSTPTDTQGGGSPDGSGGNGGDGDLDTDNPVRIGVPATQSGAYASLGEFAVNGVKEAVRELNNNGGIDGRAVEAYYPDNELDSEVAIQNVRSLVNEQNVHFITGVISSGIALAISPVCQNLQVPFVSSINGTDKLTGSDCHKYAFRVNNNAPMGATSGMKYLMEDRGAEKIYFLGSDYAWPQSVLKYTKIRLEGMGYDPSNVLVAEDFAPLDTQDYSSKISSIANSEADTVFLIMSGTPGVRFLSQARDFGLMQQVHISGTTLGQVDQLRPLGEDALGLSSISRWIYSADTEGTKQFVQRYIDEHGQPPQVFTGAAYQGIHAIKACVEEAGSSDPSDTVSAFEGLEWEDPLEGQFKMRAEDHQALNPNWAVEVVSKSDYDTGFNDSVQASVVAKPVRRFEGSEIIRSVEETGCQM